jgi:hypothetical protein
MSDIEWRLRGDYFETCNCDYLCLCQETKGQGVPTEGDCIAPLFFQIETGNHGAVTLDGLGFAIMIHTPGPMADGGWTVGLIVDARASAEQRDALAVIGRGDAGGVPARLALVTEEFAGIEYLPIRFEKSGMNRSVEIGGALDQAIEGVPGRGNPDEPIYLDNTGHPANNRLALAKATRSHVHVFGIDWDDVSGVKNGHLAPFDWQGP